MISKVFNPFHSFRIRILIFVTVIVMTTIVAIYYINQHLEQRIANLVEEHIDAISTSIDLVQTALPSSRYLYELVEEDGRITISLDEGHIIHRILISDDNGRIIDSADADDVGKNLKDVLGDLSPLNPPKTKPKTDASGREPELVLTYMIETEKGSRRVTFIVSPHLLAETLREESRQRLIAIAILSLVLVLIVGLVTWRFTGPIQELSQAARRVSSGDFDFSIPVRQRDEMGALARAFNEMLAGLRSKRELEEKLQRAERSALTGRIASGIAHEIRNPLSFINLTIDFMRGKFAPQTETLRTEYTRLCDTVKDEIGRLNRMVSDFLSYGRPAKLKLREIDAQELMEEVASLVRAKADQQGVSLSITAESAEDNPGSHTNFQGDVEQLKTCFSNLTINAVQAMDEGGSLKIILHPQKDWIRFEVSDTGSGIAPDAIDHIFEPYFSTKETGIGLGLPLTKKLIEDHGGRITVSSEVGTGTTFTVTLPREPAPSPEPGALPQPTWSAS
ncbi:MAG TPA: ATP-binding protein [Blastocatellia bacterium]|nr:ATP-binding protein [Blastocatellia bacterium]